MAFPIQGQLEWLGPSKRLLACWIVSCTISVRELRAIASHPGIRQQRPTRTGADEARIKKRRGLDPKQTLPLLQCDEQYQLRRTTLAKSSDLCDELNKLTACTCTLQTRWETEVLLGFP